MEFTLRDEYSIVTWRDGRVVGSGPALVGSRNAFLWGDVAAFGLTPTGPMITPDANDPVNAYYTIHYYGFLDVEPEESVPGDLMAKIDAITDLPEGAVA